jgi:hypothetical protein
MVSGIWVFASVCGTRRHAATDGLENEREDVAGDEDFGVKGWLEARVGGAEGVDDAGETEIQAGGVESRSDGETDDLDEESILL